MRPVPMPPILARALGAERTVIIGEPGMNPADEGAPQPAEYAVTPSTLYPGRSTFHVLLALSKAEREAIEAGDGVTVLLTLDGAEVPWQVSVLTEINDNWEAVR